MSQSQEVDEIQRQMAEIRCSLQGEVQGIVENAREMVDWRNYVRSFPLPAVGVALALGYLVVPRKLEIRSPDVKTLEKLAKRNQLVIQTNPTPEKRGGLVGQLFNFAASLAVRGAMAYLGQQAGKVFGQQAAELQQQPQQPQQFRSRPF